jgi:hypothetical protein
MWGGGVPKEACMRRIALSCLMLAVLAAGGCASVLQAVYDDRAYDECDREPDSRGCYDEVEENSRAHRGD